MYSFKCGDDSKNNLKGISKPQSKNIKFEDYKKFLGGEEYQRECNIYIIRSINHEMVLQERKKTTLSVFDDKRCYIRNKESTMELKIRILNNSRKYFILIVSKYHIFY